MVSPVKLKVSSILSLNVHSLEDTQLTRCNVIPFKIWDLFSWPNCIFIVFISITLKWISVVENTLSFQRAEISAIFTFLL